MNIVIIVNNSDNIDNSEKNIINISIRDVSLKIFVLQGGGVPPLKDGFCDCGFYPFPHLKVSECFYGKYLSENTWTPFL